MADKIGDKIKAQNAAKAAADAKTATQNKTRPKIDTSVKRKGGSG